MSYTTVHDKMKEIKGLYPLQRPQQLAHTVFVWLLKENHPFSVYSLDIYSTLQKRIKEEMDKDNKT